MKTANIFRLLALLLSCCIVSLGHAMTPEELTATLSQAAKGSVSAQVLLGIVYLDGSSGVAADPQRAAHWFERAALQGSAYAESRLAALYESGQGVPRDLKLAADWWRRAAKRGDMGAQLQLGRMYMTGVGMPQDLVEARKWLERSASAGSGEAAYLLSHLYRRGIGGIKDETTADALAARAAYGAYGDANAVLRQIIADFGHTTDRPLSPAAIQDLATDGDTEAQLTLAMHYERGTGGQERNVAAALQWYERAAGRGSVDAMRHLARLLERGTPGIPADPVAAEAWKARAAAAAR